MKNKVQQIKNMKSVKRANEVIREIKLKDGIKKSKDQIRDKKYNEYCKAYNRTHENKIHNTEGGWRPRKVYATTKTRWQRELEEKGLTFLNEKCGSAREYSIRNKMEAVILWDGEKADVYFGETEKRNEELLLKIKVKNKKIKIHAEIAKELWAKDGPAEVETAGEKMKTTELLRIAMLYKTQIYKIKSIE